MKRFSKLIAVLLALVLIVATAPAAKAAGSTVAPGETASVSFTFDKIYGIDGEFTFSNPSIISGDVTYSQATTMMGSVQNNLAFYFGSAETSITITVSFKVSADAKEGDKCDVAFKYETSDVNGIPSPWDTAVRTVTVAIPEAPSTPPEEPSTPPTEPIAPQPTEPAPTTPTTPSTPVKTVDYTELNKQIDLANTLVEKEYTADSWAVLADALADALKAKESKDQKVVDDAAAALAEAIKNLVKLDYTALEDAIASVESFLNGDALEGKLSALMAALNNAKELLGNAADQESIDAAAKALIDALAELEQLLEDLMAETEPVETQPTEPAEPTDDYCNISMHYVWPVLFFISLAVNIAFVVLAVLYIRRKKKETDDTPLVDYEIGDDAQ